MPIVNESTLSGAAPLELSVNGEGQRGPGAAAASAVDGDGPSAGGLWTPKDGVNRVIFLDVDGVLCNFRSQTFDFEDGDTSLMYCAGDDNAEMIPTPPIERRCMTSLKWLMQKANAHVVVSSSWRLDAELRGFLLQAVEEMGLDRACVLGDTPSLAGRGRGEEIKAWLEAHVDRVSGGYVVLDDGHQESCEAFLEKERFVLTQMFSPDHSQEGLTEELAKAALKAIVH